MVEASWCDGTRAETTFRLSAKRISLFKSAGASVQSTTGSRGERISGSNAGYTMFRGSVKGTGYPLHSPASPSLPLSCLTVCHHISTGLYQVFYQVKSGHDVKLKDYILLLIRLRMGDALPICLFICLHTLHRIGHPANCNLRCSSPQLITKSSPRSE